MQPDPDVLMWECLQQQHRVSSDVDAVKQAVDFCQTTLHSSRLPANSRHTGYLCNLAETLARSGLYTTMREGKACDDTHLCFVRHSFIICQLGPRGAQIFVDPFFREQFAVGFGQLAQPYHHFVSTLPQVFIGTLQMLHSACSIVTQHLEAVLGCVTALPPWRSVGALLSRWLPTQFVDTAWWPHSAQMMSVVVNTGKGTTEQFPSEEESAHAAISSLLNRESTSHASTDENPTGSAGSSKPAGAGSVSPAHVQVVGFLLPKIDAQAIELAQPNGNISYSIAGQQQALPPPHSIQQQQQQLLQGRQQEDQQLVCRSSISAPVPVPARTSGPGGHKHAHLSTHLHMLSPSCYKPADSTSAPHSMQTDGSMGGAVGNSSAGTMRSSGPSQSSPVSALTLRLRAEQKRQRERELEQQQTSSALTACTSASPPSPWSNASHCSATFYATSGAALETADCS